MTNTTDWLDSNAGGTGGPGVYFGEIGHKVIGTVAGTPRTVDTEHGERLLVEMVAAEGSTAHKGTRGADGVIVAGDEVALWVKPGAMATAIREAIKESGAKGISDGDTLVLAYIADGVASKPSWNPPKQYGAKYKPAVASVSIEEF